MKNKHIPSNQPESFPDKSTVSSGKSKINADQLWEVAWTYIRTVVDTIREPFLILDENLKVLSANKTFYTVFKVTPEATENKKVYDLGNGQWNIPKLKILLEDILPKNTYFEDFRVEHEFPSIGFKIMMLNARRIHTVGEERPIMLLAMEDVTRQKELEKQLRDYAKTLTNQVNKRTAELEVRVRELERLNRVMVGREMKMIELKKELDRLKRSRGRDGLGGKAKT